VNIPQAITAYQKNPSQNVHLLRDSLFKEIWEILSRKRHGSFYRHSYNYRFIYTKNDDLFPSRIIASNHREEPFGSAVCVFFDRLIKHIEKGNQKYLEKLISEERNHFIRNKFYEVIHNHVFKNNRQLKEKNMSDLTTDDQDKTPLMDPPSNEISHEEKHMAIDAQKEAFFWIPGTPYFDETSTVKQSVYIAFFYMWLRMISGANKSEIANEVNVNPSSVTRWRPQSSLQRPFKTILAVCPVYWNKESRKQAGLFDQKIRCYNGAYQSDYVPVENRKKILWEIYEKILMNHELIDHLSLKSKHQTKPKTIDRDNYSFEIAADDELRNTQKKELVIHITSFKVHHENENTHSD